MGKLAGFTRLIIAAIGSIFFCSAGLIGFIFCNYALGGRGGGLSVLCYLMLRTFATSCSGFCSTVSRLKCEMCTFSMNEV